MPGINCSNCEGRIIGWEVSCPICGDNRLRRFNIERARIISWMVAASLAAMVGAILPWL